MLLKCSYCSTLVKTTLEANNTTDCFFCGKVISEDEEWFVYQIKRKQRELRKIGKRRRQEFECEQSCVTTADYNSANQSDSGSTASSTASVVVPVDKSINRAATPRESDGSESTKSAV